MTVEPLYGESCPTCGQPKPSGFATGTRSLCPDPRVRAPEDTPDPDGPEGYEVITRLARGESAQEIADSMALTLDQVESLKPYISQARNIKYGLMS